MILNRKANQNNQENGVDHYKHFSDFLYLFFWIIFIAAFIVSISIDRGKSDSWIGQDIWFFLLLLVFVYALNFAVNEDIKRLVYLSIGMVFVMNAISVFKYHFIYGTAVDQAVHLSLIRTIQTAGTVETESVYNSTPGFHVLASMFGELAGLSPVMGSKLISSLTGCMIPIGFFLFCRSTNCENRLIKWVLFFAGLSSPLLYFLNGTRFSAGFFVIIVLLITTREQMNYSPKAMLGYTILILLFLSSFIFWHATTTIVLIVTLVGSGLLEFIFERSIDPTSKRAERFIQLGVLLFIAAFTYWMYEADMVWTQFVRNIRLVLETDITSELIPNRVFEVGLWDRILIGLFYHARDILSIGLAFIGLIFLFFSPAMNYKAIRDYRKVYYFWITTIIILIAVFLFGYGALGYRRFLIYPVSMSPLLAGLGYWRVEQYLDRLSNKLLIKIINIGVLLFVLIFASIQLFPYQPVMPKYKDQIQAGSNSPPILYLHQVNTIYQYQMIDFALNHLGAEYQKLADYNTQKQAYQFFGRDNYYQITLHRNQKTAPAYILLHWPDGAGGFAEQAEYRSEGVINSWRNMLGISTIYDNGYSFILVHPANAAFPFFMEGDP